MYTVIPATSTVHEIQFLLGKHGDLKKVFSMLSTILESPELSFGNLPIYLNANIGILDAEVDDYMSSVGYMGEYMAVHRAIVRSIGELLITTSKLNQFTTVVIGEQFIMVSID